MWQWKQTVLVNDTALLEEVTKSVEVLCKMADKHSDGEAPQKQILLNAFDMSTIGHLSPGQWKDPSDRSTTKRRLDYWINLAKLLEKGDINALFLADTYGGYDTYENSLDDCIRRAAQWPMTDPTIVCW